MDILSLMELVLDGIVEAAILIFEFIGVGIIIFSGIRGFYLYLRRSPDTKLTLAKGLAMGLEFKLGSEILRTVVVRDWREIGTVAGIKPVITINQRGEVAVQGKCIGKHRAMDRIAKAVEETEREDAPVRVLYTAGTGNAEELAGRLKKAGVPIEEEFMLVGSTVGAHAGPNAYAVAFFAKK